MARGSHPTWPGGCSSSQSGRPLTPSTRTALDLPSLARTIHWETDPDEEEPEVEGARRDEVRGGIV